MTSIDSSTHNREITNEMRSENNLTSNASVFFEEEIQLPNICLEDSKEKNRFLTKVGLLFCATFVWYLAICFLVRHNQELFLLTFGFLKGKLAKWMLIVKIVVGKIIISFFSKQVRKYWVLLTVIDVLLLSILTLAMCLRYEQTNFGTFSLNENWVTLIVLNFVLSFGVFSLSTLYRSPVKIYNYWFGIFGMWMINLFSIMITYLATEPLIVRTHQYIFLTVIFFIFDAYIALNAYFVVNYRTKKFNVNSYIFCYFCFWTDWFSFFWKDVVQYSDVVQDKIARASNDRRRKQAKEVSSKKIARPLKKEAEIADNLSVKAAIHQDI
jgi:hypothetical protein